MSAETLNADEQAFAERVMGARPDSALSEEINRVAGVIYRVEANWDRETSGPHSRFAGTRREVAQAVAVVNYLRTQR